MVKDKYYKLAQLIKLACKEISRKNNYYKDFNVEAALGFDVTDAHPEQLTVTDDSGYRCIFIGDDHGNMSYDTGKYDKNIKNKGYCLLYTDNERDEEGGYVYKCFPPVKVIADRLRAIANKETFYVYDVPDYTDDTKAYDRRGVMSAGRLDSKESQRAIRYFADTVNMFADKIAADPRTAEEIFKAV